MEQHVDIFFTCSSAWYSRLLRWAEKSKVSHTGLEYNNLSFEGDSWTLESSAGGVETFPTKKRPQNVTHRFRCQSSNISSALKEISELVTSPYDWKSAFFIGLVFIVWKLLKVKIKRPFNNSRGQVCSEMVSRFLKVLGSPGIDNFDFESVTPQMLLSYCRNRPELFVEVDIGGAL